MRSTTTSATSIHKVRRDARGGKHGDGWRTRFERIRRPDPTRIHAGKPDATLTGVGGLASFGGFCRESLPSLRAEGLRPVKAKRRAAEESAMAMGYDYDLVVLGGGSAGIVA